MCQFSEENSPCWLCDEVKRMRDSTTKHSAHFFSPIQHEPNEQYDDLDNSHLSLAPLIRELGFSLEEVQQRCLDEFKNDEETVHLIMLATLRDLDRGLDQGEILHNMQMPQDTHDQMVAGPAGSHRNTFIHHQPELKIIEYSFHEGKNKIARSDSSSLIHHKKTNDGTGKRNIDQCLVPTNADNQGAEGVEEKHPAKRPRRSRSLAFPPTMNDNAHYGRLRIKPVENQHYPVQQLTQCGRLPPSPFAKKAQNEGSSNIRGSRSYGHFQVRW